MPQSNRWGLVVAVALTVFMAALDISIVAVALPTIEETFGTRTAATEWVALGYLLSMVALSLPSGQWLDRVGKRAAMLLLVSGFAVTSVLVGAAPSFGWLVGARVAQGAFGAALFALLPVIVVLAVDPAVRGRALGLVTAVGPLGAVTGPALGGLLVDHLGWQWIFYANVPVALLVLALVRATMPADGPLRWPDRRWAVEAVLLAGATTAVLLALSFAPGRHPGWAAAALVAVPLLMAWARLPGSRPVLRLGQARGLGGALVALLALAAAGMGVQYLMPYFLRDVTGLSPSAIGLVVLAVPLGMVGFGPVGGWLADRWGALPTTLAGGVVVAGGIALLVPLGTGWGPVDVAWRLAVVGVGSGLANGPLMARVMELAPSHLLGTVGAASSLARNLGFAVGPALAIGGWAATGYRLAGMRVGIALAVVAVVLGLVGLAGRVTADRAAAPSGPDTPGGDAGNAGAEPAPDRVGTRS